MGIGRSAFVIGGALAALVAKEALKAEEERARRVRLSTAQVVVLVVLTVAAVISGFWLVPRIGPDSLFLAFGLWAWIFYLVRNSAKRQAQQRERVRAAERAAVRRRHELRMNELGRSGVSLIERAESATKRIAATEAARTGWFGDLADIDFSADLATIAANLKAAKQLRGLIDELKALPSPTAADRAMLEEAKGKVKRLEKQAEARAKLLDDCSAKARLIDESLKAEREQARLAVQRDDVRSRMSATLYGIDAAPGSARSESVERVIALVDGYQEIRAVIERARSAESGGPDEPAAPPAAEGLLTPISRAWKWVFD